MLSRRSVLSGALGCGVAVFAVAAVFGGEKEGPETTARNRVPASQAARDAPQCDLRATPDTLPVVFYDAAEGTICLAPGDYGAFEGGVKTRRVTLRGERREDVHIELAFKQARNVTVDRVTVTTAVLSGRTSKVTVRNSRFTGPAVIRDLEDADVLFDNNTHLDIDAVEGGAPARIHLGYAGRRPSGVTVRRSLFAKGDADGIQTGVGMRILDNEFRDIREAGPNHTDAIQLLGARGAIIRGNYIHGTATGIVGYDGVDGVTIERNVIDNTGPRERPWGIELYGDNGSRIRHNTLVHGKCAYNLPCGLIELNRKDDGPAGQGTILTDNVATAITMQNGSKAGKQSGNLLRRGGTRADTQGVPRFAGGANPKRYRDYRLRRESAGRSASSVPGI